MSGQVKWFDDRRFVQLWGTAYDEYKEWREGREESIRREKTLLECAEKLAAGLHDVAEAIRGAE